jgi:hypothetical protein
MPDMVELFVPAPDARFLHPGDGSTFLSSSARRSFAFAHDLLVRVGCCWLAVTLWQQAQVQPQPR